MQLFKLDILYEKIGILLFSIMSEYKMSPKIFFIDTVAGYSFIVSISIFKNSFVGFG